MSKTDQLRAMREAQISSRGSRESRPTLQPTERPPSVDRTKPAKAGSLGKPEVASGPREAKRGRPRLEDVGKTIEARKPWLGAMSRATWYRRRKENSR